MFSDFDDGNNGDSSDGEEPQYSGFPYDPDDKPGGELGEIFRDNGWTTWGDFLDDHWGQQFGDDPTAQRTGIYTFPEDFIFDLYDSGALDWANIWLGSDGFYHYEVESTP